MNENKKDKLNKMIRIWPENHDEGMRRAFYNVVAIFFSIVISGIILAIYFIMQPFLRPLLWAVLCGFFLFPFKYKVVKSSKHWLRGLQTTKTPLFIGIFFLPFYIFNKIVEFLVQIFWNYKKMILICTFFIPTLSLCIHFWPLPFLTNFLFSFFHYSTQLTPYFSSNLIWLILAIHILFTLIFYSHVTHFLLSLVSSILWLSISFHLFLTSSASFSILFISIFIILLIIGFISIFIGNKEKNIKKNDDNFNLTNSPSKTNTGLISESEDSLLSENIYMANPDPLETRNNSSFSNSCLIFLIFSLFLHHFWIYNIFIIIFPFLILYIFIKFIGNYLNIWSYLSLLYIRTTNELKSGFNNKDSILSALIPGPVKYIFDIVAMGDKKLIELIYSSMDKISSLFVVFFLLFFFITITFFSALEVRRESMYLLDVSGDIFNNDNKTTFSRWLPEGHTMKQTMDSLVSKSYLYGRQWIINQVHSLTQGEKEDQLHIEKQILKLWDNLYNSWQARDKSFSSYELDSQFPFVYLRKNKINLNFVDIVRENIDLFLSVSRSIWNILVSNAALSVKLITTIMSLVFGGGTALFNSALSLLIFLSTLFYLLSSSSFHYKPVEIFAFLGFSQVSSSFDIGKAFQEAISSVFVVSLKISCFYGLYTFLTHSIFSLQIIFIPAAIAAILASVPFIGTYVAAIPGIFELWLVKGQPIHALILFLLHYFPPFFIDATFYAEIKGEHPYLTALAILGGIYWMGLEGAIVGPVVLCCFVAAVHVYQIIIH